MDREKFITEIIELLAECKDLGLLHLIHTILSKSR